MVPSDETFFTTDNDDPPASPSPISQTPPNEDHESDTSSLPQEAQPVRIIEDAPSISPEPDLDIVLYGSSPPIKWQFVYDLLNKVERGSVPLPSYPEPAQSESLRRLVRTLPSTFPNGVDITDRTIPNSLEDVGTVPFIADMQLYLFYSRLARHDLLSLLSTSLLLPHFFQTILIICRCLHVIFFVRKDLLEPLLGITGENLVSLIANSFLLTSCPWQAWRILIA